MKKSTLFIFAAVALVAVALYISRFDNNASSTEISTASKTTSAKKSLMIYCAAGVKSAIEPLAKAYERDYGVAIHIQYGGSGTLLSSLQVSGAGDLFLAGDASYIEIAAKKGLTDEVLPLATIHPVLVVGKGNPKNIRSIEDLLRNDIRICLANPDSAAIGKQTVETLKKQNLWEKVSENTRLHGVFKPTVNDIANDLKLGSADAGIIFDNLLFQYPDLVPITHFTESKVNVEIAVLRSSTQATEALRFARYLNSKVGNAVFTSNGFSAVEGDEWSPKPEITFFCGAVNRRAIDSLIREFELREGVVVNTIYNGCGILTAQMNVIQQQKGSGFPDTYLACDRYYLDNVAHWFQEDVDISDVRVVIAVQKGNPQKITSLKDLTRPGVRVTVGQPEQCTIGALTRILLQKEGLYTEVMANVVTQTASSALLVPSVTTKSADAAIAYYSDTLAEQSKINIIEIDSQYALAIQPFSIAQSSSYKHLGRRLLLKIKSSKSAFDSAGFHFRAE